MILHVFFGIELKEFVDVLRLREENSELGIGGRSLHVFALIEFRYVLVKVLFDLVVGKAAANGLTVRLVVLAREELKLKRTSYIRLVDTLVTVYLRNALVAFLSIVLYVFDGLVDDLLIGIGESYTLGFCSLA